MELLPLFHNVKSKTCLVVGGGNIAYRKITLLHRAGASITAIAPDFISSVYSSVTEHGGRCISCDYADEDLFSELVAEALSDCVIAIVATDDEQCQVLVSALAQMHNTPVNVVDAPELCTCFFPSIVERGALTVAVSTAGNAPVMARLLRARLESWLPARLSEMIAAVGEARHGIRDLLPDTRLRMRFWDSILQDSLIGAKGEGSQTLQASSLVASASIYQSSSQSGSVDTLLFDSAEPDHVRFFQLRLLQAADVLLYSSTELNSILDLARRDADRVLYSCSDDNNETIDMYGNKQCAAGLRVVILHYMPTVAPVNSSFYVVNR